jgi:DNA modification methylase
MGNATPSTQTLFETSRMLSQEPPIRQRNAFDPRAVRGCILAWPFFFCPGETHRVGPPYSAAAYGVGVIGETTATMRATYLAQASLRHGSFPREGKKGEASRKSLAPKQSLFCLSELIVRIYESLFHIGGYAMKIELRPLSDLSPYPGNPRVNEDAVAIVAKSIQEYGFRQPIVVDAEYIIICGHTRYKAALMLGLKEVPVHVATDLTPEQVRAYRLADNKTAEASDWDYDLLPIELGALKEAHYDLDLLGFDPDELAQLLDPGARAGLCDPDDVPAPPDAATTQRGDLWLLGEHRLLCADSSKPQDVDRLLDGEPIHLVNTDPPYNVKVEPRSNNAIAAGLSSFPAGAKPHYHGFDLARDKQKGKATHKKLRAKDRPLANDFVSDAEFDRLLVAWFGNMARVLLPGRGFYIWGGYANCGNYPPVLKATGLYFSQAIIWMKEHPVLTRKDFMGNHEWCFYGWRDGAAHQFFGPNNATDVWPIKKINPQSMIHLTEKPVELAVRAMQYSSRVGENILDCFGGSGSTLIAAQQTRRRAFVMELDPLYCDVIIERFEKFTAMKAERISASPSEAKA